MDDVVDARPDVAVVSTTINNDPGAYADWPAIVAGAVIAAAISFVLFTFGTAVGLSITSPYPAESVSATTFAIVLGLWILWVTILSFLAGGYFTGLLMRERAVGDHEREMRDGMHGALSWALAVLLGAMIAAWTAGGVVKTGAEAAGHAATAAAATGMAPTEYFADTLIRSDNTAAVAPAETDARRGEVLRIFQRYPSGEISAPDQT